MKPLSEPQSSQSSPSRPVDERRPKRKKPYSAPELKEHGTIQQIVQNSSSMEDPDLLLGFELPAS